MMPTPYLFICWYVKTVQIDDPVPVVLSHYLGCLEFTCCTIYGENFVLYWWWNSSYLGLDSFDLPFGFLVQLDWRRLWLHASNTRRCTCVWIQLLILDTRELTVSIFLILWELSLAISFHAIYIKNLCILNFISVVNSYIIVTANQQQKKN